MLFLHLFPFPYWTHSWIPHRYLVLGPFVDLSHTQRPSGGGLTDEEAARLL